MTIRRSSMKWRRQRDCLGSATCRPSVVWSTAANRTPALLNWDQECPTEGLAIRRAEAMARNPTHVGALAFKRTGDPNAGAYDDATILKSLGLIPANLDKL